MADRPILFSTPMVRALLTGTKTQTRRVIKPQPPEDFVSAVWSPGTMDLCPASLAFTSFHIALRRLPRHGDRLWVRESIDKMSERGDEEIGYKADWPGDATGLGWRPSIHMPRWASRLTLPVADVRVQRLQDISEEDAKAEGIQQIGRGYGLPDGDWDDWFQTAVLAYRHLWDSLNADRGFGWDTNPWVCAVSVRVDRRNIDEAA